MTPEQCNEILIILNNIQSLLYSILYFAGAFFILFAFKSAWRFINSIFRW